MTGEYNRSMRKVLHKSIVREMERGGVLTTTLCGRMNNNLDDGWNVAGVKNNITCKHCLNAMKTEWGKKIIEQSKV